MVGASTGTGKFPVAVDFPLRSSSNVGFKWDRQLHQVNGWSVPYDDVRAQVRGSDLTSSCHVVLQEVNADLEHAVMPGEVAAQREGFLAGVEDLGQTLGFPTELVLWWRTASSTYIG